MKPLRLLLIEDLEDDAMLLDMELQMGGFVPDYLRVETPEELESALEGKAWDAVIADYSLPEFTGLDALAIIRSKGLDLPFILVSGVIGEEKAVEAMKAGAHDFILKGSYSRLAPALERELEDAAVRRGRREAEEALRRAHEELEQRVAGRTSELARTNEALRSEIARRQQTDESLRSYAQRLIVLEEKMRRQLAAELHDELGRDLTALGLNFNIISRALSRNVREKLDDRIRDSICMLEEMGRNVRSMMNMLIPSVLDDYGLVAALRSQAAMFTIRTGIVVDVRMEEIEPRLSAEVELAFFRIAQEALTNVSKHAGAKGVTLELERYEDRVLLSISDDGRGFDTSLNKPSVSNPGWGLTLMRERSELIGARFSLDTKPGQGTVISVEDGGASRCPSAF